MSVVNSSMKIDIVDRQDVYLICSYYEHKNDLRIMLLDHNKCEAFSGYATDIDLMRQAATIRMVFADFISLTLKALTKTKPDGSKFLYCLEKNCESSVFKWKSVDHEETIISIGSVKLTENDYKSMTKDAFILLTEEMTNLKEQLALTSENLCDLKKEMKNSVQLLTDINNMKELVENELYSKFTLVLNEKKQKIRDLKRKTDDVSTSNVNKRQAFTVNSKKLHLISDSSDESVSEHDRDITDPSTSKCNKSLLFFDDDEPEMQISPSKKRNRNRTVVENRVSPPRIPKTQPKIIIESESEDELFNNL